jgi:outer membrane protein assembly factor BamD (BamD/ComL family)
LWGYIPAFPSMDKTIKMYEQIIKNGPYSDIAPAAQMNIGAANEKKLGKNYPAAAQAYERAADRYSDRPVSADALYKAGTSYEKQAKKAEYDQSVAGQAISTFSDFSTLHPQDARVPETQKTITSLKTEQARGSYETARFYEHHRRWQGALIYYNEVLIKDPASKYAESARQRIDAIKKKIKE